MDNSTKSFDDLIKVINESAGAIQRNRGTYFEELVQIYLQNEPIYKNLYSDVWQLKDVPVEYGISKVDTGVDLVAKNRNTGELTAIQAKFHRGKVGKGEINSFIADLGKSHYSAGMIVSTTDEWNQNALDTVDSQTKQIQKIGLSDLRHSKIDWSSFNFKKPKDVIVKSYKKTRDYQERAIELAQEYFKTNDRGMLVMAPGTGKTFTSLKMVEKFALESKQKVYNVLYLVPSIQLLTQTLFGWNADSSNEFILNSFAVTSDRKATKVKANEDDSDILATDIGFPATTNADKLIKNYQSLRYGNEKVTLNVIFSTYQSVDVINQAQELGYPEFDFIVSDEAHRTTGIKEQNQENSSFTKVHSNDNVKGKLRLYQTATPKIYSDDAKSKGIDKSVVISSMDDESIFGKEIFRLGFGEAVSRGYLTDYKVMVLTVEEGAMTKNLQQTLADAENGLNIDDVGRIVGVWNGMIKREGVNGKVSGQPMKRAISFIDTIANSKKIAEKFNSVVNEYLGDIAEESFQIDVRHVDGTLNALQKKDALDWLAGEIDNNEARVLSNVKFLTEGIDVPNLDAVIFFAPKKSQVDIVQAVGRIMRKFEGKEYGYIILPIVIPAGTTPENVLDDNKTYAAVWQILNALRATDERFNAIVNQLQLNKKKPDNINVINPGKGRPRKPYAEGEEEQGVDVEITTQTELELWDEIQDAIFGKIVKKVGDRRYLEDWSKDVNEIAQRYIRWINQRLNDKNNPIKIEFTKFVRGLQININESITQDSAVEMLAQHLITKPVFEALFDQYSFVNNNPVSKAMETIIIELQKAGFEKEQEKLAPFYESVKLRASGIDNAEGKQKIIISLYDKFFSTGFKSTTDRLGIVFTPIEVVDFIVKSVDDVMKKHFGKSLASEGVHILDPFTGTGTFIARTLTYFKNRMVAGDITLADITRKYTQELHANEIVLLSYYIAAINIEATFDDINGDIQGYTPFEGIVLTDTFESTEHHNSFVDELFNENNLRLKRQQEEPIFAIVGNPPYSVGQTNANDHNLNMKYPYLEKRIDETYARNSMSSLKKSNYNSYVKAIRWATDKIKDNGVIGFITANGFIDKTSSDGIRKSLYKEFNHIYIINLRGGTKGRIGEEAKKEGGNIFNIVTGVAIFLLVKDSSKEHNIYYHDVGEYLNAKDKLEILNSKESIDRIEWEKVEPDDNGDWINKSDLDYDQYPSISDYFHDKAIGVSTNRDIWVYNFDKKSVTNNSIAMIDNFNSEVDRLSKYHNEAEMLSERNLNDNFIKWTRGLNNLLLKNKKIEVKGDNVILSSYRPFTKKWLFYDKNIIEMPGRLKEIMRENNRAIVLTGIGARRPFSALVTDCIPNLHFQDSGQVYFETNNSNNVLFEENSNIAENIAQKLGINLEDAFYYVYGVLNSNEYKEKFVHDLKKSSPRIPFLKNKEIFIEVGKKLVELHLNYENVPPYEDLKINYKYAEPSYEVKKMKFHKRGYRESITFNSDITISDIPEKAYEYIVNGRSAIEWIMDQYQAKTDKKSGIADSPNDYSEDEKYIFNLLLSVINVSVQTVDLINSLPPLEIEE